MAMIDGGPAFPTDDYYDEKRCGQTPGMTLRDWFAGQAITCLGNPQIFNEATIAHQAYLLADAMLREREK